MRKFSHVLVAAFVVVSSTVPCGSAFSQHQGILLRSPRNFPTCLCNLPDATLDDASNEKITNIDDYSFKKQVSPILKTLQLAGFSFLLALLVISWEDLSMAHPMRQSLAARPLDSTVRGMAFGQRERQMLQIDIEPEQLQSIPSYNEVMLKHRTERVPSWEGRAVTRQDVHDAVRTVQRALLLLDESKTLATEYEWDSLATSIRSPLLHSELEEACGILKRADGFLSVEARDEVGFNWGRWVQS
jgi:hypothetical protein